MIKKLIPFIALPAVMFFGSCATQMDTAGRVDQNDDVYYSRAVAREEAEVVQQQEPPRDYVTDEELYGDAYGYQGDYAARIHRFHNYSPWRNYYSPIYSYYDPFLRFGNGFDPFFYDGFGMNNGFGLNIGLGFNFGYNNFYGYNPWRRFGYNSYGNNFWGPQSYYNTWNPYGLGNNYYVDRSENYRARPSRSVDNMGMGRGSYSGDIGAGAVIRDGNGAIIPTARGRAESYRPETNNPGSITPRTSTTRPPTQTRPDRVSNTPPQRTTTPTRVSTPPPSSQPRSTSPSNSGDSSSGRSSNSSGGARPSRGN